ncbi:MAG: matrixin family metalloprotease [Alphaproteobacteria bacterium]|nr:matrixin family metalloprotease [Alphaproteobacteria bacterium]
MLTPLVLPLVGLPLVGPLGGGTRVTGTVVDVQLLPSSPDSRIDLPRTRVTVQLDDDQQVVVMLPGSNAAPPVVVAGVPEVRVGQLWQLSLAPTPQGLVPVGLGHGMQRLDGAVLPIWNLNGLHYAPDQLPLTFYLNEVGSEDLGFEDTEQVAVDALDAWSRVGCSSFAFAYGGTTDLIHADDGQNVLAWEDAEWTWGAAIAGLTATRFEVVDDDTVRPSGADILFNGVDWAWTTGIGDVYLANPKLNASSVVVHELGHVTGMDHELGLVASTMFFAYIGGDWQGSLSGDDRRGLCENYGDGSDECGSDDDCEALYPGVGLVCRELDGLSVCDEVRDEIGGDCSRTDFNCPEYCVFTNNQATAGYCSEACDTDDDCPDGYECGTAPLFLYDEPNTDETLCVLVEVVDSGGGVDSEFYCPDDSRSGVTEEDGCGCTGAPSPVGLGLPLLVPLLWRRRRRARV